jgi:hypothetical protein
MDGKPSDRAAARNALVLNLATTPGLGSFLAGRRAVGLVQMLMAVSGFVVLMLWFWDLARQFWSLLQSGDGAVQPDLRQLMVGGVLFGGAWLWSLWTSISILRQSKDGIPSISVPGPTSPPRGG